MAGSGMAWGAGTLRYAASAGGAFVETLFAGTSGLQVYWRAVMLVVSVAYAGAMGSARFQAWVRRALRPAVLRRVREGGALVVAIQRYESPLRTLVFEKTAHVVSETCYTLCFPLIFWSGHPRFARHLTLLLATATYTGNSLKDLFSCPRPLPPARRLRVKQNLHYKEEYGMPSTHVSNSVALASYSFYYWVSAGVRGIPGVWNFVTTLIGLTTLLLLGKVAVGRLYLGMHTAVDLAGGLALAVAMIVYWISMEDFVEAHILTAPFLQMVLLQLSFAMTLLLGYPVPLKDNVSYRDSLSFHGNSIGVVYGCRLMHDYLRAPEPLPLTSTAAAQLALRAVVGFAIAGMVKEASKPVLRFVVEKVFRLCFFAFGEKKHSRLAQRTGLARLNSLTPESVAQVFIYAALGLAITFLAPAAMQALGI